MRLLTLEVRDFRGIASHRVELLPTGVTLLEGPNEAGKTSLAEAVEMLFERHDSSSAAEVREAQPVGRDVGPEVEVEAEAGDYRFRYRKRFLRRPETVLEILAPRPEHHTGREAHDRVLALLDEVGVDRDLWRALRMVQGAGSRQPEALASSPSLLDALGTAAARAAEGGGRPPVDLHQRIREEAARYWTGKRGDPTGELRVARQELEDARREEAALADQMAALEEDAERASRLERRRLELAAERQRARDEADAAAAGLERVERLEARVGELRSRLGQEHDTVDLLREVEAARRRSAELEDRLGAARTTAEQAAAALAPAEKARDAAAARLQAAEARLEALRHRARLVERLAERRTSLADLEERAVRVRSAAERLAAAEARLAELPPVDDEALAGLDRLHREIQRLEAGLEAAAPRFEITARAALELEALEADAGKDESDADENREGKRSAAAGSPANHPPPAATRVSLAAGESWTRQPARPLVVELPGVARLTVAPGGDAAELGRALEKARAGLAARCRTLGVADSEAARGAHRDRRNARSEVESGRAVLASLLGSRGTSEELERRRRQAEEEVQRLSRELAATESADLAAAESGAGASSGGSGNGEPDAAGPDATGPGSPEASGTQPDQPEPRKPGPSPSAAGRAASGVSDPEAAEAAVGRAARDLATAREALDLARREADRRRRDHDAASGTVRELEVERRNAEERRRRAGERARTLLRRRSDGAPPASGPKSPPPAEAGPEAERRERAAAEGAAAAGDSAGAAPTDPAPTPPTATQPAPAEAASPAADPGQLALFAAVGAAAAGAEGKGGPPTAEPPSLAAALAAAEARVAGLEDELAEARRRLAAAEPDRVRRAVAAAREARNQVELQLREAEDDHLAVRTRLDSAGERGLFEALEEARGRRAAADRAAAAVEARAAAARRLLRAMDDARDTARRAYSEPLARMVEELGRPLFGDGFAVELDPDLNVARRTAFGLTLELERLSTGAQEQLSLLTRLACAVLVSPTEGVPLVVDDALGHSDADRLRALGEVLSRVGERCQVLILTCFPDRYRHVQGARRVRLEATAQGSSGSAE